LPFELFGVDWTLIMTRQSGNHSREFNYLVKAHAYCFLKHPSFSCHTDPCCAGVICETHGRRPFRWPSIADESTESDASFHAETADGACSGSKTAASASNGGSCPCFAFAAQFGPAVPAAHANAAKAVKQPMGWNAWRCVARAGTRVDHVTRRPQYKCRKSECRRECRRHYSQRRR
jgi:hypothetical protein